MEPMKTAKKKRLDPVSKNPIPKDIDARAKLLAKAILEMPRKSRKKKVA